MKTAQTWFAIKAMTIVIASSVLVYGVLQVGRASDAAAEIGKVMIEASTIPTVIFDINTVRNGNTVLENGVQGSKIASQFWQNKVERLRRSNAYQEAVLKNVEAHKINRNIELFEPFFLKALQLPSGSRTDEQEISRIENLINNEAVAAYVGLSIRTMGAAAVGWESIVIGLLFLISTMLLSARQRRMPLIAASKTNSSASA